MLTTGVEFLRVEAHAAPDRAGRALHACGAARANWAGRTGLDGAWGARGSVCPSAGRFSHDCNIFRTNATDGAHHLRYLLPQECTDPMENHLYDMHGSRPSNGSKRR